MLIAIFDDDIHFRLWMEETIQRIMGHKNIMIALNTGDTASLQSFITKNHARTLYFLDLVIGKETEGLSMASLIREKNKLNVISFITQYPDKILFESLYKMMALNTIIKGNTARMAYEIKQTIEHAYSERYDDVLTIKDRYSTLYRFLFEDIMYIESVKGSHRIAIYYKKGIFECPGTLKEAMKELDRRFVRCHHSYIVNLDSIHAINRTKQRIFFKDGKSIAYSKSNKGKLEKLYDCL